MKVQSKAYVTIKQDKLDNYLSVLSPYVSYLKDLFENHDWKRPESSILLPSDESELRRVKLILEKIDTNSLQHHIVIGIGGSYFGPKAIYDALGGTFDVATPEHLPKTIFVDTCDPTMLRDLHRLLSGYKDFPEGVLVTVISKSGTTTETIVNLEVLLSSFDFLHNRLLVVSGESSLLSKMAVSKSIPLLTIPDHIGGRYSVLSAVGLLPLYVAGIDVAELMRGADTQVQQTLTYELTKTPAFLSAAVIFDHLSRGFNIHNTFVFHPELETFGKWYRQLMGESIGKLHDLNGQEVHAGMTPTVSVGSTDLHSVVQLYLGGPRDKLTTFLSTSQEAAAIRVPWDLFFPNLVEDIEGKSAFEIIHAILKGTQKAYDNEGLPYIDIELNKISEFELGELCQFKMFEMMFLAKLLNLNAFDQPQVELYKQETRELLKTF
ncbi:hypothetical protein KC614_00120 [candidate division WWE3 bacterium]|uniref:Glucose-6-phosphate isomerase n=1 Tax=candidate division WWE3 bacterium TaxID=2053526 RepID=A0A955LJK8_UNCKA|nr:hypothetical protein [candidate division WWE3 bacterium]